jgi:hypothetical protein
MTSAYCSICLRPIAKGETPAVQEVLLSFHGREYHPDVMPWACETCFYVPPGVKGVRCTDICDGVCCPMYKPRPAWLRI